MDESIPMTDESLNHIVEMIKKHVEEEISEGTKVIEPFLVICGFDKEKLEFDVMYADMRSAMPEDGDIKKAIFASLGHACIKQSFVPFIVVIVSEAWMLAVDPKEFTKGTTPRPSEHKDRVEIVDITALTSDKRSSSHIYIIGRDDKENLTVVDKQEFKFGDEGEKVTSTLLESFYAGASLAISGADLSIDSAGKSYFCAETISKLSKTTKDLLN